MSGWMRLYVFAALLVAVPLVVAFVFAAFVALNEDRFYVSSCELAASKVTTAEARMYLSAGIPDSKRSEYRSQRPFRDADCRAELDKIVSGEEWRDGVIEMLGVSAAIAAAYVVFFLVLYGIGRGVGWVWRGFFPAKA